jgi:hypothetical protein
MNTLTKQIIALFCLFALVVGTSCYYDKEDELYPTNINCLTTTTATFSGVVLPILNNSCNGCHGGVATAGAGIKLDNYAGVKTYADNGKLIKSLWHEAGASPMPKNGAKLDTCTTSKVQRWILAGANNN